MVHVGQIDSGQMTLPSIVAGCSVVSGFCPLQLPYVPEYGYFTSLPCRPVQFLWSLCTGISI